MTPVCSLCRSCREPVSISHQTIPGLAIQSETTIPQLWLFDLPPLFIISASSSGTRRDKVGKIFEFFTGRDKTESLIIFCTCRLQQMKLSCCESKGRIRRRQLSPDLHAFTRLTEIPHCFQLPSIGGDCVFNEILDITGAIISLS